MVIGGRIYLQLPYQPTSFRLWNSLVMAGMAVAMMEKLPSVSNVMAAKAKYQQSNTSWHGKLHTRER